MTQQASGTNAMTDDILSIYYRNLQATYQEIRFLEPVITSDIKEVVSELGSNLSGLQYSVKTASSISDKLDRDLHYHSDISPEESLLSMKDVIRYTEICEHDDIFNVANDTIDSLKEKGYILSGVKNYYLHPFKSTGYMGLHLNFISPYGQEIELQVHSEESFEAKQRGHELYEQLRSVSTPIQDKKILQKRILEIHNTVDKPFGYQTLKDFSLPDKKKIMSALKLQTDISVSMAGVRKQNEYGHNDYTKTAVYSVQYCGHTISSGFELKFSDDSMQRYNNDHRTGTSVLFSIDKNGTQTSYRHMPSKEFDLQSAKDYLLETEMKHHDWMDNAFIEAKMDISDHCHAYDDR